MNIKCLNSLNFCQKTFVMIKPDAHKRKLDKEIQDRIKTFDSKVEKEFHGIATEKQIRGVYAQYKHKVFFDDWVKFMTSGNLVAIVLDGENAVDEALKLKCEIRKIFAPGEIRYNLIHASDSEEEATREIKAFFNVLA